MCDKLFLWPWGFTALILFFLFFTGITVFVSILLFENTGSCDGSFLLQDMSVTEMYLLCLFCFLCFKTFTFGIKD